MRIELVKRAVKNLVVESMPSKKDLSDSLGKFRKDIADALGETHTVYVATFWHVDSMSGYEWNLGLDGIAGVYAKWVHELEEAECDGVIGLFEVKVPHTIFKDKDELHAYIEELEAEDELETRGRVLDSYRVGVPVGVGF